MIRYALSIIRVAGACAFISLGATVSAALSAAQFADGSEPETLAAGQSVRRQIGGGEAKSFRIRIPAGQYLHITIQLNGIILRATLLDASANPFVTVNNPSGGYGTIYLSDIAATDALYTIKVFSTEDFANPGEFQIRVEPMRAATPPDEQEVAAERWFAKAVQEDEAGLFEEAIKDFGKSLTTWQEIGNVHWQATAQYALAQTHRKNKNLKLEEELLNKVLKFHVDDEDWRLTAAALNDLGFNETQANNNEKAESHLKAALQMFENHGDPTHGDRRGQASARNNLAILYGSMGDYHKALDVFEPVLQLRRDENFEAGANNALNTLAVLNNNLGEPYRALDYSNQALAGWQRQIKDKKRVEPDQLANAFNSVAVANERVGNLDLATQNYQRALEIPGISDGRRSVILDNHGDFYASQGDFETALALFTQAKDIFKSTSRVNPDLLANVLLHIAQLKLLQGDVDSALAELQQAEAAKPNKPKLSYVVTALGDCWRRRGDLSAALKSYQAALDMQVEIDDRRGQAITREKIGETHAALGNLEQAMADYQAALNLWRAVSDRRGEAATLNDVGLLEQHRNNLAAALERSEEAVRLLESTRANISSHKLRTTYFAEHENYYELNIDLKMILGQRDRSAQMVSDALAASEQSRARGLVDMLAEERLNLSSGSGDELLSTAAEIRRKVQAKSEAQTALLSGKHSELAAAEISNELSGLLTRLDEIEGRIRFERSKYAQLTQPRVLASNEIQRQLDDETVLLEYALGERRSYAWVVTSAEVRGFELAGRAEIENAAARFMTGLAERNRKPQGEKAITKAEPRVQSDISTTDEGAVLSKLILEPVAPLLDQKRLLIVPDGALQTVSFAALPVGSAGNREDTFGSTRASKNTAVTRYLIEDHEIISLPSASVLSVQRRELENRKPAPHAIAVFANPVFTAEDQRVRTSGRSTQSTNTVNTRNRESKTSRDRSINRERSPELTRALEDTGIGGLAWLPYSLEEARAILKVVPKSESLKALDFQASRPTAMSPQLAQYRIIHFATHGLVDQRHPELSGLVLSMVDENGRPQDGYLRLHDIYNLNLPAELVVLSACESGVGKQIKGEGLIALTRGFMYAGARSVVASLWKVNDAATAALMAQFYKEMFVNGLKPAAALRSAQRSISRQKPWQAPYFWAGFVLQGEWR